MEHIVQFGVSIDDNAIIEAIKRNAEREIIGMIKASVENTLFDSRYYYNRHNDPNTTFGRLAKDMLDEFLK